ncbi:hypothetical protein KEM56_004197, partial [Ascosphaera pollenicola]
TLREKLEEDVRKFVPGGFTNGDAEKVEEGMKKLSVEENADKDSGENKNDVTTSAEQANQNEELTLTTADLDPEYLKQLRTLISVRSRLESVIKIFGDAMAWPLPPPEEVTTITDSFITISTPADEGISEEDRRKSEEYIQNLRNEITDLLAQKHIAPQTQTQTQKKPQQQQAERDRAESGVKAAQARVDGLRRLVSVFAGTAEEAPRLKVVEELQRLVDERKRQLEESRIAKQNQGSMGARGMLSGWRRSQDSDRRSSSTERNRGTPQKEESVGTGLLRNLARLRDEIYLE